MSDAPALTEMPLAQVVEFWRPGSHDWTWVDEYADIVARPETPAIRKRVQEEGIGFLDHVAPILLGSDGRVWDGHHRICIAIEQGIGTVNVEKAGGDDDGADDNPQPRTITLAQSEAILEAGRTGRYEDHEAALRAAGIEVDDAINVPTHCAACGRPAEGFAMINDQRYCHPDDGPSCYMGGRS